VNRTLSIMPEMAGVSFRGARLPVRPAPAIFALDDLPEKWAEFTAKNAAYYGR
jgi:hypothetical protein